MTNMQLAYTEYLEDKRHHQAEEANTARDITEKSKHNRATEQLSQSQQALDKYIAELNNATKRGEIATRAEVDKLRIMTDKAIRDKQNELSAKQYDVLVKKTDAEIANLYAQADRNAAEASVVKDKSKAEVKLNNAKAAAENAKAFGTVRGLIANVGAQLAPGASSLVKKIVTPEKDPQNILHRDYAVKSTGGTTTKNTYRKSSK